MVHVNHCMLMHAAAEGAFLLLGRGCDAVAPVIHEWTYEAMIFDLLGLTSNTFEYEVQTVGGKVEKKEHILDERDELWVSICCMQRISGHFQFTEHKQAIKENCKRTQPLTCHIVAKFLKIL